MLADMAPELPAELLAIFIPIVAIVMGIGIGMLAIYLDYRKRREMFSLYHQERMAAIEKGIELPPLPEAFFAREDRRCSPHRNLLRGLVLLFVGLVLFVALLSVGKGPVSTYALIVAAVGVAFLIFYSKVEKKQIEAEERKKAQAPPPPAAA